MKISVVLVVFRCALILFLASCQWGLADQGASAVYEIKEGRKWGFINRQGEVIIKPQFDLVVHCVDNITVRSEAGWFAVRPDGGQAILTKLPFDAACYGVWELAPGLYATLTPRKTTEIVDLKGRFNARVDDVAAFREGLLPIKQTGKWGAVDRFGRIVIKPTFDMMDNFYEGKAAILVGRKWGYVDSKGKVIIEPRFRIAGEFAGGIASVYNHKKWSYIKPDGTAAFDAEFAIAGSFRNGRAVVAESEDGLFGYIDTSGRYTIEPKYTLAGEFSEGLAPVQYFRFPETRRGRVAGYIDLDGNLVIPVPSAADFSSYLSLWEFHQGLALVIAKDGTGYIDKNGKWVWKSKTQWYPSQPGDIAAWIVREEVNDSTAAGTRQDKP